MASPFDDKLAQLIRVVSDLQRAVEGLTERFDEHVFKKPTVEQVRDWCSKKGYELDAEAFCDHYESKNWHIGKTKMSCWKRALANANRNGWCRPKPGSKEYQF